MVQVEDLQKIAEPDDEPCKPEKPTLLSKYRIPVQHLDFEYVESCKDAKELEKILNILRSGEEGYFPHLVEATEKRLAVINPNSKVLRKVCPVLQSSEICKDEWEGLSKDLAEWVEDVNRKDQELEDRKVTSNAGLTNSNIRRTEDMPTAVAVKSTPKRIKATDYESWDKYDPDTEILKMELEEEKLTKDVLQKQKVNSKKTVRFNNFATDAEAVFEANLERDRGNECFKAGEFPNALQHYSNSLECKPFAAVYTNRALTYNKLKKYRMAIDDCKLALKLEPRNFKAHLRMAQSYNTLEQYNEALESVEIAIEIDPNNTAAQQLAERVRKQCGITISNKRFNIQDVNSSNTSNTKVLKPILKSIESANENKDCNKHSSKPSQPILKSPENKIERKAPKSNKSPNKGYEVISIPGSSGMPPPYYKIVHSSNAEVIKREKQKILAKPGLLHITIIDVPSDEEDIQHPTEDTNDRPYIKIQPIKSSKRKSTAKVEIHQENCELENVKFTEEEKVEVHIPIKTTCARKPCQQINTQQPKQLTDNQGAGGEPCGYNEENLIPTEDELRSPYTFIETWNSVRKDTSHKQQAEVLRKLDCGRLHQVIGYKLDDTMLSNIINCLHKHFMVPGELDRLHAILTNITQIPRFEMLLLFLEQSDWKRINQLIQFLDQHGRDLPSNIRNTYTN